MYTHGTADLLIAGPAWHFIYHLLTSYRVHCYNWANWAHQTINLLTPAININNIDNLLYISIHQAFCIIKCGPVNLFCYLLLKTKPYWNSIKIFIKLQIYSTFVTSTPYHNWSVHRHHWQVKYRKWLCIIHGFFLQKWSWNIYKSVVYILYLSVFHGRSFFFTSPWRDTWAFSVIYALFLQF